ncbi:hypothetical protein ACLOJK_003847 [Asimina triloba]
MAQSKQIQRSRPTSDNSSDLGGGRLHLERTRKPVDLHQRSRQMQQATASNGQIRWPISSVRAESHSSSDRHSSSIHLGGQRPTQSTTSDEPADLYPGHGTDAGQQESQLSTAAAFQLSIHPMHAQINLDRQQQIRPTTAGRAHCSTPKLRTKPGDPMSQLDTLNKVAYLPETRE